MLSEAWSLRPGSASSRPGFAMWRGRTLVCLWFWRRRRSSSLSRFQDSGSFRLVHPCSTLASEVRWGCSPESSSPPPWAGPRWRVLTFTRTHTHTHTCELSAWKAFLPHGAGVLEGRLWVS